MGKSGFTPSAKLPDKAYLIDEAGNKVVIYRKGKTTYTINDAGIRQLYEAWRKRKGKK